MADTQSKHKKQAQKASIHEQKQQQQQQEKQKQKQVVVVVVVVDDASIERLSASCSVHFRSLQSDVVDSILQFSRYTLYIAHSSQSLTVNCHCFDDRRVVSVIAIVKCCATRAFIEQCCHQDLSGVAVCRALAFVDEKR